MAALWHPHWLPRANLHSFLSLSLMQFTPQVANPGSMASKSSRGSSMLSCLVWSHSHHPTSHSGGVTSGCCTDGKDSILHKKTRKRHQLGVDKCLRSSGCINHIPWTRGLVGRDWFSHSSADWPCQGGRVLVRPVFLSCRWPSFWCVLTWPFLGVCASRKTDLSLSLSLFL